MMLIGKADTVDITLRCSRVNQDTIVAFEKAVPFKVSWYTLRSTDHIAIQALANIGLLGDDSIELAKAVLHLLDDMGLERGKVVLHGYEILTVGIFFHDLLVQAMHNSALKNVGVIIGSNFSSRRVKCCSVLPKQLNVLLSSIFRFINSLAALSGALDQLL
jgi:hypothetical protein